MNRMSLVVSLSLLAACGTASPDDGSGEACEHLQQGPSVAVTAASDSGAAPPSVTESHKRFDIALVADQAGGAHGGRVSYASSSAGDHALYLSAEVPVEVTDASGTVVTFESTVGAVSACTEVKSKRTLELGVGTDTLRFGHTYESNVSLVIESVAHAD